MMVCQRSCCIFFLSLAAHAIEAFAFSVGRHPSPTAVRQSSPPRPRWIAGAAIAAAPGRPTRLWADLWQRMGLEEDEEPQWYLLNCVIGLEQQLLERCRLLCGDHPDAVRFVVPTEYSTRSHGARRIITERKVKVPGYVFAKLRLCPELYEKLSNIDIMRTFTGPKKSRKLPTSPTALDDDYVQKLGLEDMDDEPAEEKDNNPSTNAGASGDGNVIMDSEEDESAPSALDKITEENLKVYNDLKVEDLVKVTKESPMLGEDGIVRRLKGGKVLVRFYTYGSMFEKWMEPGDVRKLSNVEILQGLSGPTRPITQADFDGPGDESVRRGGYDFDRRQRQPSVFGGGQQERNRRQDRIAADFRRRDSVGRSEQDRKRDDENWKWYQDQQRRGNRGTGFVDDGNGRRFRSESRSTRDDDDDVRWGMGDADSQWGRQSQRPDRRERKPTRERLTGARNREWEGTFVPPKRETTRPSPDPKPNDFFNSLVADLTPRNDDSSNQWGPNKAAEDEFMASLLADLEDTTGDRSDTKPRDNQRGFRQDDSARAAEDEFSDAELDRRSDGRRTSTRDRAKNAESRSPDDDFFAKLEQELSDIGSERSDSSGDAEDLDDFFASLDADRAETNPSKKKIPTVSPSGGRRTAPGAVETNAAAPAMTSGPSSSKPKDFTSMTVPQLKDLLRERKMKVSGTKAELIERLSSVGGDS